jgi:hypothetical protein
VGGRFSFLSNLDIMPTRREFIQQSVALSTLPFLPPLDFENGPPFVTPKKCDPRVISIKGIHSDGNSFGVEFGNHLRFYVGTDHGLPDTLDVFRKPSSLKKESLIGFIIPSDKTTLIQSLTDGRVDLTVETSQPGFTLPASIRKIDSDTIQFSIRFPQVVGYTSITSVRDPRSWKFKKNGSNISLFSGLTVTPAPDAKPSNDTTQVRQPQLSPTMRTQPIAARRNQRSFPKEYVVQGLGSLKTRCPKVSIALTCLYQGELVRKFKVSSINKKIVNYPFDELRMDVPIKQGVAVEFVLMENDSAQETWTKFETIKCAKKLLEEVSLESNKQLFFSDWVDSKFWSDVNNRFLNRPIDGNETSVGTARLKQLYGGISFDQLITQVNDSLTGSSLIQRVTLDDRRDDLSHHRGYHLGFEIRDYNEEELGFLLLLAIDVNIATLIGLHTVDRGQPIEMKSRLEAKSHLNNFVDIKEQAWDYKVEGKWSHLSHINSFIFYDLEAGTTPGMKGEPITKIADVEGMEVVNNQRKFKVGMNWEIDRDPHALHIIAYDVYRNGKLIQPDSNPITPARSERSVIPNTTFGRIFNSTLPFLPPFSPQMEVKAPAYVYVDDSVPYGPVTYAVESVDAHGRVSKQKLIKEYVVNPSVPVPPPIDFRSRLVKVGSSFEMLNRWDWGEAQRALSPNLQYFDVLVHDGPHHVQCKGFITWLSRPDDSSPNFSFEAFVQKVNNVNFTSVSGTKPVHLLCGGMKFSVTGIRFEDRLTVNRVSGTIQTKQRLGLGNLPSIKAGTKAILFKKTTTGIKRIPALIKDAISSLTFTTGTAIDVVVETSLLSSISASETLILGVQSLVLGGKIKTAVDPKNPYPDVKATVIGFQFSQHWENVHLPYPEAPCELILDDQESWIDRDDESTWSFKEQLQKPAVYPLVTNQSVHDKLPVLISSTPPEVVLIKNSDGVVDQSVSHILVNAANFAASASGFLAGCQLSQSGFDQRVTKTTVGDNPQVVIAVPSATYTKDAAASALQGKTALISRAAATLSGNATLLSTEAGSSTLKLVPNSPVGQIDWRLCILETAVRKTNITDIKTLNLVTPLLASNYFFRIKQARVVTSTHIEIEVENIVLTKEVTFTGMSEADEVDFEIYPETGPFALKIPKLCVGKFRLADLTSTDHDFYQQVDGGEVVYPLKIQPGEPGYDATNTSLTRDEHTSVVAISRQTEMLIDYLHIAFYPVFSPTLGFKLPGSAQLSFFPSFRLSFTNAMFTEAAIRERKDFFVTVRAVANEEIVNNGTTQKYQFKGNFANAIKPLLGSDLLATAADLGSATPPTLPTTVYADPGPMGSVYKLTWGSVASAFEYKVYRISKSFINSIASWRTDRQVLDSYGEVKEAMSLRNKSILKNTTFTDILESRGKGEYYYRIIPVDKSGTPITLTQWTNSLIIPDPVANGPLHVLDTIPLDKPAIQNAFVRDGKVILEFTEDPRADEYWITRESDDYAPEPVIKIPKSNLSRVPITFKNEQEKIRVKMVGTEQVLDLFWMEDMHSVTGIYLAEDYWKWLKDKTQVITNHYKLTSATGITAAVKLIHRNGTIQTIYFPTNSTMLATNADQAGVQLMVEYIVENEVELPGTFTILNQEIEIRKVPQVAKIKGIFPLATFDPQNYTLPQACSCTEVLTGAYPVIHSIKDGNNQTVPDDFNALIVIARTNGGADEFLFGYPVSGGTIKLVSPMTTPILTGASVNRNFSFTEPAETNRVKGVFLNVSQAAQILAVFDAKTFNDQNYSVTSTLAHVVAQTGTSFVVHSIKDNCGRDVPEGFETIIVYKQNLTDQNPSLMRGHPVRNGSVSGGHEWTNLFDKNTGSSYNGSKILGISSSYNGKKSCVTVQQFEIRQTVVTNFTSIRIEGFPKVVAIDELKISNKQTNPPLTPSQITIPSGGITFNRAAEEITFAFPSPPPAPLPAETLIVYTDETGIKRTVKTECDTGVISTTTLLPKGISQLVGIWRSSDFSTPINASVLAKELVITKTGRNFLQSGSLIRCHSRLRIEKNECSPIPITIIFKDDINTDQIVNFVPGKLNYNDSNPLMNTVTDYQIQAVKIANGNSRFEIPSPLSDVKAVEVYDKARPVPPVLEYRGRNSLGQPEFRWPEVAGIKSYVIQRRSEGSPTWISDLRSVGLPTSGVYNYTDDLVENAQKYFYRLRVIGNNRKDNIIYRDAVEINLE